MPGETSRLELASTAHGRTASIASSHVLGAEPAGEHHPAVHLASTIEDGTGRSPATAGRRRGRPPRRRAEGPHPGHAPFPRRPGRAARDRRLLRPCRPRPRPRAPYRARGARAGARRGLPPRGRSRPGPHRPRRLPPRLPPASGRRPSRAGARGARRASRPGWRAHERGADEDRVRARELRGGALGARFDPALCDHDAVSRRPARRGRAAPRRSMRNVDEVAGVDPDHRRAERDAIALSSCASCASTSVSRPSRAAASSSARACESSRSRRSRSAASAPASRAVRRSSSRREEPLRKERQHRRGARRTQVVPGAAETLVDEDRDRGRAGPFSYAAASAAGSASGRRSPADGERRLTSAIAVRPGARSASAKRPITGFSRERDELLQPVALQRHSLIAPRRPLARPRARSSACPAAAIAPAALSTTASLFAPARARGAPRGRARSPAGEPPASSVGIGGAIPSSRGSIIRSRTAPSATSKRGSGRPARARRSRSRRARRRRGVEPRTASASATVRATSGE